jgi:curved DNA-binding protein CbpA
MRATPRDHYAVLGVPRTASHAEIRAAFRRLARAHHPDASGGDPVAEREFKRVARAWAVLGDASRRRIYDQRHSGPTFGTPGEGGPQSFAVDHGPIYHMDLGHHSDFYQAGDPLTVREAGELVGRASAWLRRAIRNGRLAASRDEHGYLVRRRDVERLDRTARRRRTRTDEAPSEEGGDDRETTP